MGVDMIVRLVVGVPIGEPWRDGRSFTERVVAGEFGEFRPEEGLDLPSAVEEFLAGRRDVPVAVFEAFDAYSENRSGTIVGVGIAEVHNRGTPRNLGGGLTEQGFDEALRDARGKLGAIGMLRPRLWLVQSVV